MGNNRRQWILALAGPNQVCVASLGLLSQHVRWLTALGRSKTGLGNQQEDDFRPERRIVIGTNGQWSTG